MNRPVKTIALTLGALAVVALLGGSAVVGFGLYNVAGRAGHLPGVSWVLHRAYQSAVYLRAPPAAEVPADLRAPERIALGSRHFDRACRFCHAAPGERQSATAAAMVPRPPPIAEAVGHWQPRHLHWIVWSGVKMSGMPYWPAEGRRDEVWSIVAFLDSVPQMSLAEYEALTALQDLEDPLAAYCAGCHGTEGDTTNRHIPRLDIQPPEYLALSLAAYREGRRESGFMAVAAAGLDDAQIDRLAQRFGRPPDDERKSLPAAGAADMPGAQLARRGTAEIPACTRCHGPGAQETNAAIPALAGQNRAYLATQLRLWRDGGRGGGPRSNLMVKAARALSDADIDGLADWYSALPPAGGD